MELLRHILRLDGLSILGLLLIASSIVFVSDKEFADILTDIRNLDISKDDLLNILPCIVGIGIFFIRNNTLKGQNKTLAEENKALRDEIESLSNRAPLDVEKERLREILEKEKYGSIELAKEHVSKMNRYLDVLARIKSNEIITNEDLKDLEEIYKDARDHYNTIMSYSKRFLGDRKSGFLRMSHSSVNTRFHGARSIKDYLFKRAKELVDVDDKVKIRDLAETCQKGFRRIIDGLNYNITKMEETWVNENKKIDRADGKN